MRLRTSGFLALFCCVCGVALVGACAAGGGSGGGFCGDGVLGEGESCDGVDLGGESCASQGQGAGTLGCAADCTFDTSGCGACSNECSTGGETRCNGNALQTCETGGSGCLAWNVTEDCEQEGLTCDDSSGTAQCVASCSNACATDELRCDGTMRQTCGAGDNGCLQWKDAEDCGADGGTCQVDAGGIPYCQAPCSNACSPSGGTQCNGGVQQTCQTGASGCLEWLDTEDCTSSGRFCDTSTGACACSDLCAGTETRCAGNTLQTCTADSYGCLDFVDTQDCTSSGLICSSQSGTAQCAASCTDACTQGLVQCSGSVVQTCQTAASGCLDWVNGEDCSTTGRLCTGGSCECNHACPTEGATQCSGSVVQTCQVDTYGCRAWHDTTDCSGSGSSCSGGACVGYTQSLFYGTFTSIAATGSDVTGGSTYTDDGRWGVALPFTFLFYGVPYTSAWICSNGWLSLGADPGTNTYSNTTLPASGAPNQVLYVFWDDLVFSQSTHPDARIVWRTTGSSGSRIVTFEWYQMRYIGTDATYVASFQIKLYEATGVIEFLYDRAHWAGANYSGTVGLEDDALGQAEQVGAAYSAPPSQDVRFTPN